MHPCCLKGTLLMPGVLVPNAHPNVLFKKLHEDAVIPSYAKPGDAGMDLHCLEGFVLYPGERKLVKSGLAMAVPDGYECQVRPRSGHALKKGVTVLNSPGTIDSGYRGEVGALLINTSQDRAIFTKGDAIAQLVIAPVSWATVLEVPELPPSDRGTGGWGSTGS